MNLPKAYLYNDENMHHVCSYCPDKEEAEKLAEWTEDKREAEEAILWGTKYVRRKISHTICDGCLEEQVRGLSNQTKHD